MHLFFQQMDDIDAMFSEMLGEMDLLTQVSSTILHPAVLDRDWRSGWGGGLLSTLISAPLPDVSLFHLQSLEQEISPPPPPASAPEPKEEIKLSIGFTDLNGDWTVSAVGRCCNTASREALVEVLHVLIATAAVATCVRVSTASEAAAST